MVNLPNGTLILYSDLFFPITHSPELLDRYTKVSAAWNYPVFDNPRQLMQYIYQLLIFLLHWAGVDMHIIQRIFLIGLISVAFYGIEKLLSKTCERKGGGDPILMLCAGLLFLFNPYAISSVWQRINLGIIAYCFFPILVYVIIQVLKYGRWWYFIYGGIIILIAQSSNPVHLFSSCFLGFLLASIIGGIAKVDKYFCIKILKLILIALIVNLYWIIPFFLNISDQYSVSKNNLSSSSIIEMRTAIGSKATLVNWMSLNPFWTAFETAIVKSASYLKYCQSAVMLLFAYALLTLGGGSKSSKLYNLYLLIIIFVSAIFMVKYFLYLPFWATLDALYIGAGFRDPFEKTAYFTNTVFVVFVYSIFLNKEKIRIAIVTLLTVIAVLPSLGGDLFYTQAGDPYQATGKIPEFFKDPDRIKRIIGSPSIILPIPFFEANYGGQYRLDEGMFTGMTPLYWQNGVQIVSGNNQFSLELEKAASNIDPQGVKAFYRKLIESEIEYIFVSKNYICPKDALTECERQLLMIDAMQKELMIKVVNVDEPYLLFKTNKIP
jgi:hypothetical protein